MKTLILNILILLLTLISCKDEELSLGLYHSWEAKSFMSVESVAYPKNEINKILLTFDKSGNYHLKLDINSGGGTFQLNSKSRIEMGFPAITEACCDSQFSNKLTQMLPKVTSYSIEGKILKLNVPKWGYIECELVE